MEKNKKFKESDNAEIVNKNLEFNRETERTTSEKENEKKKEKRMPISLSYAFLIISEVLVFILHLYNPKR